MEKIININFHSRVIAIEESAYEALKQYTESLRRHFADEESSEEIINDIENRIAELLAGKLKQGATCINTADLNAVIDSIGRIEDIKAAEGEEGPQPRNGSAAQPDSTVFNDRFYRNADDKVIAGVCSGIASRMRIDAVVVRILFVLLSGGLFWLYILLWIILPEQSTSTRITRRLYRNPEEKVIAGVCSGLGAYFHMESWKVRLIFCLPLIASVVFGGIHSFTWHWGPGPDFFIGSFGSTFFVLYVILWIAVPYASSSTDKMEMRGEKIDINSIKAATQARAGSPAQTVRSAGSGIGRVIGILFKSFFLLVAGAVALGLFGALIGVAFAGTVTMPFADFLLDGWNQYALTWTGIALTMGIPLLALIVWLVRRLMGVRTHRHYIGYVFAGLWLIGVVCSLAMVGVFVRNFTTKAVIEENIAIQQPSTGKLYVNVSSDRGSWTNAHHSHWFGDWDEENDAPFHIISKDSLWLNTVEINIETSRDSLFHIYETRSGRASNTTEARQLASHVMFNIQQQDSVITLPRGFTISSKDKFRNQQVLVTIEVPLGKNVQMSKDVNDYNWFSVETNRHGREYRHHWGNGRRYGTDKEYIMTASGLKKRYDTTRVGSDEDED